MTADPERARLEAVVFGRAEPVDHDEYERARSALADLLESERAVVAPAPIADELPTVALSSGPRPTPPPPRDAAPRRPLTRRRFVRLSLALIAIAAVVIAGERVRALTTTNSMEIFDRPQTEQDLNLSVEQSGLAEVADSIRYVGTTAELDAFVYRSPTPEPAYACLIVLDTDRIVGSSCVPPEEFSAGLSARVVEGMAWTLVSWSIRDGVAAEYGSYPTAQTAMDEFDEPQDDDDRAALTFVPGIRADLQRTARYLGSNSGYSLLVYRGDGDTVCLAVYVPSTTVLNAESTCVSEDDFDRFGISMLYPGSSARVKVSWNPDATTTVSLG